MIPVQLTLQGLYSYQEKQTIDFKNLTDAHLFGIFGKVGSGKSSVLEAITFALYGKTDRLNLSGDNRNYNMMNLKSDTLLIDFLFVAGKTKTPYRAVVKGRRNRKRFEDVKSLERTAYQQEDGEWIPVETTFLEKVIGLSYENFKRTIIIPQGQFQEFLQLGNKDRTNMMKELFNLGRFELYYKVTSLEAKNNEKKQHLQGQIQQLGEVDPQKVSELQRQLKQLHKDLGELKEKLTGYHKREWKFQQVKEKSEQLEAAKMALEQLKEQEPEWNQLEKDLFQYEKCVTQFKSLVESFDLSSQRLARKNEQIREDSRKLAVQEEQIKSKELLLKEVKPAYESREMLNQRAEELEKLLQVKKLAEKIHKNSIRFSRGEKVLQETGKLVNDLKAEKEELAKILKAEKSQLPDLNQLSKAKSWYSEMKVMQKHNAEIQEEINQLKKEEEKLSRAVQKLLNEPVFQDSPVEKGIPESIDFLQMKKQEIKEALRLLDQKEHHFHLKARLEEMAQNLKEGALCPLCGSTHHPEVFTAKGIREMQEEIAQEKAKLQHELEQIDERISQLRDMGKQWKMIANFREEKNSKLKGSDEQMKMHRSHNEWPHYSGLEEIEKTFTTAETLQKAIEEKENRVETILVKIEKESQNEERYRKELDKISREMTIQQTQKKTLQSQLKKIQEQDYRDKQEEDIEAERKELMDRYFQLERHFRDLSEEVTDLRKSRDTLAGSLRTNKEEREEEQKYYVGLHQQLDERMLESDWKDIDEVRKVLSRPVDIENQRRILKGFREKQAAAFHRCDELKKDMGSNVYDGEAHQQLLEEIKAMGEKISEKHRETGKLSELLRKMQQNLKMQKLLEEELEKMTFREENLKTMKSLFKGSGFVNYISSVYLQNLCHAANDRFFQLTGQKLSLEITEDNSFQVRDYMNGGKVRNVKTLSGGQTFQAALSLALALADNIQKMNESDQNFFFLDEGFGSLDPESLAVVFDTLKSLRKENRMVGVISHVEEMQQEIDVHLRIENEPEKGSIIYQSWKQ